MADKKPLKSGSPFATRIDPTKESLSQEQMHFIKQVELEQWKKKTSKLRTRNVVTGLAIGALVLGICILNVNYKVNYVILPGADYGRDRQGGQACQTAGTKDWSQLRRAGCQPLYGRVLCPALNQERTDDATESYSMPGCSLFYYLRQSRTLFCLDNGY
ncbi:hypothetical protein GOODEAATRI_011821 [Goodea atripinnis]|uniref:Cytochrome c oxidase assembly factor 3 n=1 Tax=Goodea atripinnis TaxID=208336 RepID=A0ABV0NTX8_9TELE